MQIQTTYYKLQTHAGFTFIELLISVGIMAMIAGFMIANFRYGSQRDELRLSSQVVMSSIRRAQTAAVTGELISLCRGGSKDLNACPSGKDSDCPGGSCQKDIPRGYGVRLNTSEGQNRKLVVFADINGNKIYDAGEESRGDPVSPGAFVVTGSLSPATSAGYLDIVFAPPRPTVYFNAATTPQVAVITVKHPRTGAESKINVNRLSGQISIE